MTQRDLDRFVAHSTGETVTEISRRGFVPLEDLDRECEPPIDWDELEARRFVPCFLNGNGLPSPGNALYRDVTAFSPHVPIYQPTIFSKDDSVKVFVINNNGAGFADTIELPEGTTIKALFHQTVPHARPEDYLIRLNRGPVPADYVLQDGDRVSITPRKIQGAR